ncbi:MAG: putative fluoride ion transporter CrcB [Firmicutes bacterium ADurb.Bin248]|nr:MAG: putative fluoride ion transporter CrcB [Firmicutes bacterium ADurb.Bin248]
MLDCLYVGLGGFIGSVCRYLVGLVPLKTQSGFPALTLFINVAGAFAVGVVAALAAKGAGLGLLGLHERVEALGGSLSHGPVGGGFRVVAAIPLKVEAS